MRSNFLPHLPAVYGLGGHILTLRFDHDFVLSVTTKPGNEATDPLAPFPFVCVCVQLFAIFCRLSLALERE